MDLHILFIVQNTLGKRVVIQQPRVVGMIVFIEDMNESYLSNSTHYLYTGAQKSNKQFSMYTLAKFI